MKTSTLSRWPAIALAVCLLAATSPSLARLHAEDGLTPPDAQARTRKNPEKTEARTPITALPFTISAPGTYSLTGNLTATSGSAGITIATDNVTLDLNGFTLHGSGHDTVAGINVPAAHKNLCVRNGTVTGCAAGGIDASNASGSVFENLRLVANAGGVAILYTGGGSTLKECVVTSNPNCIGFFVLNGSTVVDCTASGNGTGFFINSYCTLTNVTSSGNGSNGIYTEIDCTLSHCTASGNTGNGIEATGGCTLTDCTTGGNSSSGIFVTNGNTVRNCTASNNSQNGIYVATNNNYLVGNTCDSNNPSSSSAYAGMTVAGSGNRIEANSFSSNNYAGLVATANGGNLIIRNSFVGTEYIVKSSNTLGPLVDMATSGGTISSTSPWANFHY